MLNSNEKLGGIAGWSLPSCQTCPGSSDLCRRLCYVQRYTNRFKIDYKDELNLVESPGAFTKIKDLILATGSSVIRMHVSGDFYSRAYIRLWIRIVRALQGLRFYGYTRSWRVPRLWPVLAELAVIPNVSLWASCDRETGIPDLGLKTAWLMENDQDPPPAPVDLVFRNYRKTKLFKAGGALVCPHEFGITPTKVTCLSCRRCYR